MIAAAPPPPNPADIFSRFGGAAIVEPVDPFTRFAGFRIPEMQDYVIQFHDKLGQLFLPSRYKVLEGGRGSMKSWACARALIIRSLQSKLRILCAREYQTSIADSVHKLLKDQIEMMGLGAWFTITKTSIRSANGSEFMFVGLGDLALASNRTKIKSYEAVDICWVEEAENIAKATWEVLIPTIRKKGSEIWIVYNPHLATDDTYQRFHVNPPSGIDKLGRPICITIVMNWRENLWFTEEMMIDKDHLFANDPEAAAHVWDGELKKHAEATIFRNKYIVHDFDPPEDVRWYHGADWGFSNDPTVLVQMFITGMGNNAELWINNESWGIGVDFPKLVQDAGDPRSGPGLFEKIPEAKKWPIYGDNARPETISYVRSVGGYNIQPADKWDGSVEDGIAHLRGFKQIHVHKTRCPHAADEFRLYSYKTDKNTGEILPIIIDKHNHVIDGCRYGLHSFIQRRGAAGIWSRLGK
jgi:phage terminase large subunit